MNASDDNHPGDGPGAGELAEGGWLIDLVDRTGECPVSTERLMEVAEGVLRSEEVLAAEVSVAIVDDVQMSDLHLEFLQIAGPTDVLTFPLLGDSLVPWQGPIDARRGAGMRIGGEPDWSSSYSSAIASFSFGRCERQFADRAAIFAGAHRHIITLGDAEIGCILGC